MSRARDLVADIGGTYARFALTSAQPDPAAELDIESCRKYPCMEFDSFEHTLETYLDEVGRPALRRACISIAGPVDNGEVRMTNLDWAFTVEQIKQRFALRHVAVLNDAAAGALATTSIGPADMEPIQSGVTALDAPRVNLIPGTGFGIAAIVPTTGGWQPIPGEGGHANLAPMGEEEFSVLRQVEMSLGRATPELVLSGPGMLALYRALATVRGTQPLDIDPVELTGKALDQADALCRGALDLYCSLLGGLAGDLALTLHARGGVFLSGRLLQRVGADVIRTRFIERFRDKAPMSHLMADIPVCLVKRDFPGLIGAATWLNHRVQRAGADDPEIPMA